MFHMILPWVALSSFHTAGKRARFSTLCEMGTERTAVGIPITVKL